MPWKLESDKDNLLDCSQTHCHCLLMRFLSKLGSVSMNYKFRFARVFLLLSITKAYLRRYIDSKIRITLAVSRFEYELHVLLERIL